MKRGATRPTESAEPLTLTEIGSFPESWGSARLGELFDVQQGKALSPAARRGLSPRPFLRTANVLWGRLDLRTVDEMDFTEEEAERLALRPGDLLVCEGGEIGRTAIWDGQIAGCLYQNHVHRLRSKTPDAVPAFVMYWMQAALLSLNLYGGVGNRTTIPNLSASRLRHLAVPIPPVIEQRAIAAVLATLQSAVATQDKIVAGLKELKVAIMAKLFREGLRGKLAAATSTRFGEVPAHWGTDLLGSHAQVQTGVAKGRDLGNSASIEVPYLRVANVQDGYLDLYEIKTIRIRESELGRYSLLPGDVLLTEGGDLDKLGRGYLWTGQIPNCVHQNHIFAVRTDPRTLLPEFFAYLVQSPYGKAYFLSVAHKTTNLACINTSKLRAFPAILPPLDEQRAVARVLKDLDGALTQATTRLRRLTALFSAMLHLLMTGQVRVSPDVVRGAGSRGPGASTDHSRRSLDPATLEAIVNRIVAAVAPKEIILFGSAARGEMGPDSDIDLLVVKACEHRREVARAVRDCLRGVAPGRGKDVVVVTPEDVERDRDTIGYITRPALREGRVLYAA